jgi:hypothetical protein
MASIKESKRDESVHETDLPPPPPAPPETKPPAEPAKAVEKKTAFEWASARGMIRRADRRLPQSVDAPKWKHVVADKIHGWSDDAHHNQASPFVLSEDDFKKAIAAAAKWPLVAPHLPAVAPVAMEKAKAFVPKKARDKAAARETAREQLRGREAWLVAEKAARAEATRRERAARNSIRKALAEAGR